MHKYGAVRGKTPRKKRREKKNKEAGVRHAPVLHDNVLVVMFAAVQLSPPNVALAMILYVCVNEPPPQLLEHVVLEDVAEQSMAYAQRRRRRRSAECKVGLSFTFSLAAYITLTGQCRQMKVKTFVLRLQFN